jgi:hypothetical protein
MEPTLITPATDAETSELMDVVFKLKNAVEDRDVARVKALFTARPQICVQGRFVQLSLFLRRLEEFNKRVEHISMDIARIQEVDLKDEGGFIAVDVDFGWIDSQLWEEQTVHGIMALTLEERPTRGERKSRGRDAEQRNITGFSYAALRPERARNGEDGNGGGNGNGGGTPPGTGPAGPMTSGGGRGYDPFGGIWG